MPLIILINAITGLMVALLYYPGSPINLFHGARIDEVWLWSKYAALAAGILFILSLLALDPNAKGRNLARKLSAFIILLQGILNLPPAAVYAIFLHGSSSAHLTIKKSTITISSAGLFLHLGVILICWSTAAWLAFKKNKCAPASSMPLVGMQAK